MALFSATDIASEAKQSKAAGPAPRTLDCFVAIARRKTGVLPNALRLLAMTDQRQASPVGAGPPLAQSSNSTVCTTGVAVAEPICSMQPMFPAAMTSGLTRAMLAILRSRNALAIAGCRML